MIVFIPANNSWSASPDHSKMISKFILRNVSFLVVRQKAKPDKKHRQKTQRENTDRKHREKTQRENAERKHREKTQTENTQKTQTENTDRKHTERKHRQKTQTENTDRKHTRKTHREKTQTENTERKHRQKTQTENTDRKHTDRKRKHTDRKHREKRRQKYYTILQSTTQYYSILHSTTRYDSVLQSTTQHCTSEPGIEPRTSCFQGYNALSARQIFWDDHIQTIVIANTMRGAIVQIQSTNVHTPRPMRGAIPRAQNVRFATVSRDRPTESYERVHPAKSKCAFRYSGLPSKMSKCTFRYSGVHRNVWNERIASAVARGIQKSSFHHSFERPSSTKWRKGSPSSRGWRERHINLQSKWRQHEAHTQFIRYTQRFRRGWRGRHINLQSKWSQHEAHTRFIRYTQRFRRGWRGWHINLQSKWSPRAIYTVYTTISAGSVADWGGGVY